MAMARASPSLPLSRSCLSAARYLSRVLQGRIEASGSYGIPSRSASASSPPHGDAEPGSSSSARCTAPVVRCDGSVRSVFRFPFILGKKNRDRVLDGEFLSTAIV